MEKKKILVVDDEPLIPILMKEIIEENGDLEIAGIATGKEEFWEAVGHGSFDAALIDISVEGREGGLELLGLMKAKGIELPSVMLSAYDELQYAFKALKAGARGYLNKKYICSDVVRCLYQVLDGHLFVSGDRGEKIIREYEQSYASPM
ncbi:MAG: response regulator transcription factor [Candidatus Omnitrophica bacterium]|nr:response regulator transcription factor [Candidatus Omnitrophota bacterium]MDE2222356.1 response regulator transcription factor [Candidatus Omnitrophota bacterium]